LCPAHTHPISDVVGLQTALDGKASTSHAHIIADVTGLQASLDAITTPVADVSMNSHKVTNVLDPTSAQDAATKSYVDAVASGLRPKDAVRVGTTANIALTGTQTIDGVGVVAG
jgi:hypothetical protein